MAAPTIMNVGGEQVSIATASGHQGGVDLREPPKSGGIFEQFQQAIAQIQNRIAKLEKNGVPAEVSQLTKGLKVVTDRIEKIDLTVTGQDIDLDTIFAETRLERANLEPTPTEETEGEQITKPGANGEDQAQQEPGDDDPEDENEDDEDEDQD